MLNYLLLFFLFFISPMVYSVEITNTGSILVFIFILLGTSSFFITLNFAENNNNNSSTNSNTNNSKNINKFFQKTFFFTVIITFVFNLILDDLVTGINFSLKFICVLIYSVLILYTIGFENIKKLLVKLVRCMKLFGMKNQKIEKISLILDLVFSLMPEVSSNYMQIVMQLKLKGATINL